MIGKVCESAGNRISYNVGMNSGDCFISVTYFNLKFTIVKICGFISVIIAQLVFDTQNIHVHSKTFSFLVGFNVRDLANDSMLFKIGKIVDNFFGNTDTSVFLYVYCVFKLGNMLSKDFKVSTYWQS